MTRLASFFTSAGLFDAEVVLQSENSRDAVGSDVGRVLVGLSILLDLATGGWKLKSGPLGNLLAKIGVLPGSDEAIAGSVAAAIWMETSRMRSLEFACGRC
jgi:hypothetical protein